MKVFHILTLIALVLTAATPAVSQSCSLTVHIEGVVPTSRAVIHTLDRGQLQPSQTIGIDANGNFRIQTTATAPVFFVIQMEQVARNSKVGPIHVLLLPDETVEMTIQADTLSNRMLITHTDGSANMEEYRHFNNLLIQSMQNTERQETLPMQVEQLLVANRGNLMSAFLVTFFESEFDRYAPLYKYIADGLADRYPDHEFVRHLLDKTSGLLLAGMEAPDIVMKDREGRQRKLSDLRGHVVLVDFWASWCRPCRAENPNVVRLYHQYHPLGFEVFSVSLDKSRDQWLSAIAQDGLIWENHVSDLNGWTSSGGKTYGISSIPATVLIGPDGTILARNLRGKELENALKRVFKQ